MDYTSKSLPDDVASRFEELQPEGMTVGEFMACCLDAYEQESESSECGDVATSEDVEQLSRQLEAVEEQLSNVPRDTAEHLR